MNISRELASISGCGRAEFRTIVKGHNLILNKIKRIEVESWFDLKWGNFFRRLFPFSFYICAQVTKPMGLRLACRATCRRREAPSVLESLGATNRERVSLVACAGASVWRVLQSLRRTPPAFEVHIWFYLLLFSSFFSFFLSWLFLNLQIKHDPYVISL